MQFCELNTKEFNEFTKNNFSHYTQSIQNYNYLNNKPNQKAYLVGVKNENGKVLAACLLQQSRALKFFSYFYTQRGPVMDFNDYVLVEFFFKNLNKFLKKHKCIYIRIDPYVLQNIRSADGTIQTSHNNKVLMLLLKRLGYVHQGFDTGYSKIKQIRWLSVLDLKNKDKNQLLNDMEYQTRRNIKKVEGFGVKIKKLPTEELYRFMNLFKLAEKKHGFSFRNEEYFKNMLKTYKENSFIKLAYIELDNYIDHLQKQLTELEEEYDNVVEFLNNNPNSKKNKNKYNQIKNQINNIDKKYIKLVNYRKNMEIL